MANTIKKGENRGKGEKGAFLSARTRNAAQIQRLKTRGKNKNSATKKKTQQTCKKELRTKVREKEKKKNK